jgi:dsRNA-specific ribonuclease
MSLKNYLAGFLPNFLPKNIVDVMLTEPCMKIFERAFTHESDNSNFNYEVLEILGDSCIHPCFIAHVIKKYNIDSRELKKVGVISTLKNYFLSKSVFSDFSKKFGFVKYIRAKTTINMSMEEDVFESFCGALRYNGDHYVSNYMGQIFVNMFIDWVFDKVEIDIKNIKLYQNPTQYLKENYFDNIRTPTGEILEMEFQDKVIDNMFVSIVYDRLKNMELGRGTASEKKEARNNACKNAIENLNLKPKK